ncbi:cytochrome P450 [Colletotrichum tofieldiae]|nr:cytochrome P450 [Colletotrichum tofieldiae]GKT74339.1 cytochrome P450 [Colletotrichum tofieldiae]
MAPTLFTLLEVTSPISVALAALGSLLILYLANRFVFDTGYPPGIPLVREPVGAKRFSLRTRLAYYTDCERLFHDAYHDYSKHGKPVVIPGIGYRKEVILPPSSIRWILSQPEEKLGVGQAAAEVDQIAWSMGDDRYCMDPWQGLLVKNGLNPLLESISESLNEELIHAFERHFGLDTENWTEVDLLSTVRMVVAQAANGFIVGRPLCRDEEFLTTCLAINDKLVLNAATTGISPAWLRPIIGPIINWPLRATFRKLRAWFSPLLQMRIEKLNSSQDVPDSERPRDLLQMMVQYAEENRPQELRDIDVMMKRVCSANFGAIHQTAIQVTNLFLNILGSDAQFNTISALRDEALGVLHSDDKASWTKAKINKMIKADSVARETLRLHSFGHRVIFRKVLVDGVATPDGHRIPKGTTVSILTRPAQTDPETFEDALSFDPFRFSRLGETETKGPVKLVSTSADYLPFGHGKHACPGRFLVDFEFKIIMAFVTTHYDLKFPKDQNNGQRPENFWVTEVFFPPKGVRICVKRRKPADT